MTAVFPTVVEEPGVRWIVPGCADDFQGLARDAAGFFPESKALIRTERSTVGLGMELNSPEDLVGHPIADPGEDFLFEQERFDRGRSASLEETGDAGFGEPIGQNPWWKGVPPGWRRFSAV